MAATQTTTTTQWRYTGTTPDGKPAKGRVEADSVQAARQAAIERGVVLDADPQPVGRMSSMLNSDIGSTAKPPKLAEWTTVIRSLATTISSGLPFLQAIALIRDGLKEDSRSRQVLNDLHREISDGVSIPDAFAAQRHLIGDETVALVTAGHQAGMLGQTLTRLAEMTERQLKQRRQIIGALSYPGAIFGMTILMAIALLMTVIPTFEEVFVEFEIELPITTKIVMAVGKTLRAFWMLLPAVPIVVIWGWRRYRSDDNRARGIDRAKLGLPLIGKVLHLSATSRVADVMATMDAAGVDQRTSLRFAAAAAGNKAVELAVNEARERNVDGVPLADAFREQDPTIPRVLAMLVEQGEESAELGLLMESYAVNTADDVENKVTQLTELLQPLLMLGVMGVVAVLAIAIYSPILAIYDAVAG